MQVSLLSYTPNPERSVAVAARQCYAAAGAAELSTTLTDKQIKSVLKTVMSSGHYSTLEHVSYSFAVEGVSRALTHQLVRHRMASFEQQSQRYVTFEGALETVEPPTIAENEESDRLFKNAVEASFRAYRDLVDAGVPAEDARYLLPNACASKIVVTMNIRELLHFFELRCCNRAQWEIRDLANRMLDLVTPTAPYIFMDAGAPCRHGSCPEGKMSCGHPFARVVRE